MTTDLRFIGVILMFVAVFVIVEVAEPKVEHRVTMMEAKR